MASLRRQLPIIIIIILGFTLRIHDLQAVPLRGDEAFSALYWSDVSLAHSLSRIAPIDPHPPLTFILFRIWGLLLGGIEPVFALRYLTVLGNTIGIAAMFALASLITGKRGAGLIAALIWALHPFEIWHSQDYRNYAIWAGLSAVSLWLGLRLLVRRRRIDWLLYATVAFCTGLIFYAELFNVLAISCVVAALAWRQRQFLLRFLAVQLAIGLAAILAFAVIQARSDFFGFYGGNLESFAAADYFTRLLPTLTFGETLIARHAAIWLLVTLLYGAAALTLWLHSRRQFTMLMILIWLPLLLLGAVSLSRDIFNPRYVLNLVPALILLLAVAAFRAADWLGKLIQLERSLLAVLILSPWFVLAGIASYVYFTDSAFRKSPAWDELGAFLSARVKAGDLVIQLSVDPAFAYYYAGDAPEMALPAYPAQPKEEIIATLDELRDRFDTVFIVSREQAGWGNKGVVEGWMRANLQEVMRADVAGLPVRQFMEWTPAGDLTSEWSRFGDAVALLGFEFFPEPLPSDELLLWLYWLPLSRTEQSLKSFAHLYGAAKPDTGSPLWSQDDQLPQGGDIDSRSWQIGAVFRDVYYLPAEELPDGDYQISVGWYDPVTSQRLTLAKGADSIVLAAFRFSARDHE